MKTTILLDKETINRLKSFKATKGQTYDEVLNLLMDFKKTPYKISSELSENSEKQYSKQVLDKFKELNIKNPFEEPPKPKFSLD